MLKRVLFASSLMVSFPLWAAAQADAGKTAPAAVVAGQQVAGKVEQASGKALASSGVVASGKDAAASAVPAATGAGASAAVKGGEAESARAAGQKADAKEPAEPSPARKALLDERRQQQRLVFHLRAKRDSELNRLALVRLAASRGGDPDFDEKKNRKMLRQMQDLEVDYDRQIATAELDLKKIDDRLAALDAEENARAGKAPSAAGTAGTGASGQKPGAGKVADEAVRAADHKPGKSGTDKSGKGKDAS